MERQNQLSKLMREEYLIEGSLDFEDCNDVSDVVEAACKLLIDNFDIGMNGTYIKEIIEQA